ncbi:MAG: hypothetical protein JRN16_05450 [Nitrososphaerota archaeon]|nr:hypothetical protein [Nitrososphaerota archaeon]MDG7027834.1 hypothetical protein [Nitrososphaerota archaeon]
MSEKKDAAEQVRFFNVSLINAVPMSLPKFPQPQRLMRELIHSIEAANPKFAWVQFLFRRVNLSPTLVALKNAMHIAAEQTKTPKRSWIDDSESDRPELYRDWYRRSGERIKRIDAIANVPHVLLAIQGMWVGDPRQLSTLPFKDCYDELDRLGAFVYRNPWMLVELVERRMVEDVSPYMMSYARSRLEPPSFLVTQEEIPYYLHLPVAKVGLLKSITERTAFTEIGTGGVEGGGEETENAGGSKVLRLAKVPDIIEPLKDTSAERLALLASPNTRGLELVFSDGHTDLLVSSRSERDTQEYLSTLESVYGVLNVVRAPAKPDLLRQIPNLAGLVAQSPAQKAALGGRTRRLARGAGRLASTVRRRLPRGSAR